MRICFSCMHIVERADIEICPFCGGLLADSAPKEAYHLTPGSTLKNERYIVGRAIGYGGFGVTYAGFDVVLEKRVAIKEYLPSELATRYPGTKSLSVFDDGDSSRQFDKGLEGFVNEAQRLAKFNNVPGIVSIYDTFHENDTAYLVMELLDGETLKAYLNKKGKLSYDESMKIILPVLGALQQVHKEGIIHRDISPDNIFLTTDGQVKLLDFGAARYANVNVSKSLSVILKPGYAPVEQYRSRGVQGPWSDVYAVGATIYKMLTGTVPEESMERAAKDTLKPPSRMGIKLPNNGEIAIMNALNIDAKNRIQSAEDLEAMLLGTTKAVRIEEKQSGKAWAVPKWLKWTLSGVAVVGVVFIALLLTGVIKLGKSASVNSQLTNSIAVPNLVGTNVSDAKAKLDGLNAGLVLSVVAAEYDDLIPAGTIQSQEPQYGTTIGQNTAIEVSLSRGKEGEVLRGVVPFILGTDADEAEQQLIELGYEVIRSERNDRTYASGTVCETDPESGTVLAEGSVVEIVISLGASVTGVTINPASVELAQGETFQLNAVIEPANAENKEVTWKSADESIASVDENGMITAGNTEGKTKVTVTTIDGGFTADCEVTVTKATATPEPEPTPTPKPTATTPIPTPTPTATPTPTPQPGPFHVYWNTGTGYTISVQRTNSPFAGASIGNLSNGATVYYGDVLKVTYTPATGYSINPSGSYTVTVAGDVTITTPSVTQNSYTYNIVYRSANGTSLGSTTITKTWGSTVTISAPDKSSQGYATPTSQTVTWDSTYPKTITFTYGVSPVSFTTKTGMIDTSPKLTYSTRLEFQNRTATTVQVRVVWTTTIGAGYWTVYGQMLNASTNAGSSSAQVTAFNTWKNSSSSDRSSTGTTGWMTVNLSTTDATTASISIYYYQFNSNGTDMTSYGEHNVNTTWTISIPAY